ncbi:hypothetical protein [Nocardia lasii]|uniref:Secreted protein n=1 Tax=Nocardia lasii TaxID=1616107 RepID=A0ABW1JNR2_9NOCA
MKKNALAAIAITMFCAIGFAGPANADSYGPYAEYEECVEAAYDYATQQEIEEYDDGGWTDGGGIYEDGQYSYWDDEGPDSFSPCYQDYDGYWYFTV